MNMQRQWTNYEGQTEGYRALFMYVPSTGIIVAVIFNSAVNGENDHAGELMNKI
jgi:D-alanyl-D-alanine carboxypeptidase